MTLDQIRILDVWRVLGGGELKRNRGRAFWRDGDGYTVALNSDKDVWYDFRDSRGGGAIDLVMVARQCSQNDAIRFLKAHCGLTSDRSAPSPGQQAHVRAEAECARLWAFAAAVISDTLLEDLPYFDSCRAALTSIWLVSHGQGRSVLEEYRAWLELCPDLTAGMVEAGGKLEGRRQFNLAHFVNSLMPDGDDDQ